MINKPDFENAEGLVPAIAQEIESGEVLMLAWMNQEAWELTLREGIAVYWSRSRGKIWRKGESSGNTQLVHEIYLDCDNDTVLLKVEQKGDAACHTGRHSCFYQKIENGVIRIISEPLFDPDEVYDT